MFYLMAAEVQLRLVKLSINMSFSICFNYINLCLFFVYRSCYFQTRLLLLVQEHYASTKVFCCPIGSCKYQQMYQLPLAKFNINIKCSFVYDVEYTRGVGASIGRYHLI